MKRPINQYIRGFQPLAPPALIAVRGAGVETTSFTAGTGSDILELVDKSAEKFVGDDLGDGVRR